MGIVGFHMLFRMLIVGDREALRPFKSSESSVLYYTVKQHYKTSMQFITTQQYYEFMSHQPPPPLKLIYCAVD